MIVTELIGGLGNQMFQYALGRALAIKYGTALKLDVSSFERQALRRYALDELMIEATVLTETERRRLALGDGLSARIRRMAAAAFGIQPVSIVRERSFSFDATVLNAPSHSYLQGYWQSWKYFHAIDRQLREEFTSRNKLVGENAATAARINTCTAVSVHVRRGDYVQDPHTARYHGVCGPDYYAAAERLLRERVGDIDLFVFSDDPSWAEANLRFSSNSVVVRHNPPDRDYEDLRLMTLCRHHIIANSTFSWWGAWLCQNPGKIVIAPKKWFAEAKLDTSDLIPEGWIRL